jgi:hypothetical protein
MKRRHFLKSAVMDAGTVGLSSFPYHLYAVDKTKYAHDRVILGHTGIEVSRMAMETAAGDPWAQVILSRYNPGETRVDGNIPEIRKLLESYHEKGKV